MSGARGFQAALAAVSRFLEQLPGSAPPLAPGELRAYDRRGFTAGWRLTVKFDDGNRRLDLLVDEWFPRSAARVALVDRPDFLTWPHVERDGVLCLLPNMASVDPTNPIGAVEAVLRDACELIQECVRGTNREDFREEFLSYWNWALPEKYDTYYSLLAPAGPTRAIRIWRGKGFNLLADSDEQVSRWLANRRGEKYASDACSDGIFLWLDAAMTPDEYPHSGSDLLQLAKRATGGDLIDALVRQNPNRIIAAIGAPTRSGPAVAAVTAPRPSYSAGRGGRSRSKVEDGFRKGKVPASILTARYLGGTQVVRSPVERVDAAWILGRNGSPHLSALQNARVVILGCGSVGAPVALMLIQAGVLNMTLIDPDALKWANTPRHPLGAEFVGRNKAEALSEHIRQNYPHVADVSFHARRWQDVMRSSPEVLGAATLVVSATGDWESEGALNEWHIQSGRVVPIVYGWTEAHACAGHAVAISSAGGCLACGMDIFGAVNSPATTWDRSTLLQEPACGANYQPYGASALGHIVSTIGQVALKHMTQNMSDSSQSIWSGDPSLLEACGGAWGAGSQAPNSLVERPWVRRHDCPACS